MSARGALALAWLCLAGCAGGRGVAPQDRLVDPTVQDTAGPTLRAVASTRGVRVGAAVDAIMRLGGADGEQARALLAREFDAIVAENAMKHARLRPSAQTWDFGLADSIVAFGEAHGMTVRGHTLVWHRQVAPWLTRGTWTDAEVRAHLEQHIDSVVTRYRGRIAAWDVVNEAVLDDGTPRPTFWRQRLGEEYVALAFRRARAADPSAKLYYNDYNIEGVGPKSDSVFALVSRLRAAGVPIDGVGFQAHFIGGGVPATFVANMRRFADLGLAVQITELDVRVPVPATAERLAQQASDYRAVVSACLAVRGCDAVVAWGMTDRYSWIPNEFAGWGAALPFDEWMRRKPAYHGMRDALRSAPGATPRALTPN